MRNTTCAYVLISIENGEGEKFERTIESIIKQSVDRKRIRVLINDNATTDGTYMQLLKYEIKYPRLISIIREKRPVTKGRLLKRMIEHLRYCESIDCTILLKPGDCLYENCIATALTLFQLKGDIRVLFLEADAEKDGKQVKQTPIFTDNCIFSFACKDIYYMYGAGHKLLLVYRGLPIRREMKLPYYAFLAENQDELFSRIDSTRVRGIYIKDAYGCVADTKPKDVMTALMDKTFFVKRTLYSLETGVFSDLHSTDKKKALIGKSYASMAQRALKYAADVLHQEQYKDAEDCLIYAEMIFPDIVSTGRYKYLAGVVGKKQVNIEELEEMFQEVSVEPPEECEIIM